jgi:hypothetical protein
METLNYRQIARALGEMRSFRGNTMSANTILGGTIYQVKSYDEVIATAVYVGRGGNERAGYLPDWALYINSTKYSVTTSKHQGYVRRAWAGHGADELPKVSFEERMRAIRM